MRELFSVNVRNLYQKEGTVSNLPKWTYLLECAFMITVGAGLTAFGIWMYNEGTAITEDAVIPWTLMMACGPFLITVGFYRSVIWTFRKVRSSLNKKKKGVSLAFHGFKARFRASGCLIESLRSSRQSRYLRLRLPCFATSY